MTKLAGKVAWITGAGSGIGRAAAVALAAAGATVIVTGRSVQPLHEVALEIGAAVRVKVGDVTDAARMAEVVREIEAEFGRLDLVVTSAGINVLERRWLDLKPLAVDRIVNTNLVSAFYCVIAALPVMRTRKEGLFIHVGSRAARYWDGPGGSSYQASKAGLVAMNDSINREECLNGIRSSIVNPGETLTPILKTRRVPLSDEELADLLKPEDCAELIAYIACLPPHVCLNEVFIAPTRNRAYFRVA